MISLLAFSITNYINCSLAPLEYSQDEAELIYTTLENIYPDSFCSHKSIVLNNIKADEFKNVISTTNRCLTKGDLQIIYFSGHGILEQDIFYLLFRDYADQEIDGKVSQDELNKLLKNRIFNTLLVIDCCYSGKITDLSRSSYIFSSSNIAVIASSNKYETSKTGTGVSDFTKTFCSALSLANNDSPDNVLLSKVISIQKELGYDSTQVSYQEGKSDLLIYRNTKTNIIPQSFKNDFLQSLLRENVHSREMMWYSLIGENERTKENILSIFLDKNIPEGSWLVRRAIGTVLESLIEGSIKKSIIKNYINSYDWKMNCIGLIGGRRSLKDDNISKLYLEYQKNTDKPMDSIWLSILYLSDNMIFSRDNLIQSNILKSSWGIIEIFDRYYKNYFKQIEDILIVSEDESIINPLITHIRMHNLQYYQSRKSENNLYANHLFIELYNKDIRGPINNISSKWLYSIVYGSWRDQLQLNLESYFNNFTNEQIENDMKDFSSLPLVSHKMAILQYVVINKPQDEFFKKVVLCGIVDKHPWVIRSAIEAACVLGIDVSEKIDISTINRSIYPGLLDLLQVMINSNITSLAKIMDSIKLSKSDYDSLNN